MELSPGYKQSEVGVIPEDWQLLTIGEVCSFENGDRSSNYPGQEDFAAIGVPFINAGHISRGSIDTSSIDYIKEIVFNRLTRGKVKPGDVLYCLRGSLGKFGLVIDGFGEGAIASSLVIIRAKTNKLKVEYLISFLASDLCEQMIDIWAGGAAQPNLGVQDLARFLIPIPSINEQEAIAEALSDAEALVESLEQLLTKKREIKQGAMQELLTGQRRLPGFSGEWMTKRLGDLLTIRHGRSQREVESANGNYPILATGGEIGKAIRPLYDKPSVLIGRKGTIDRPQYMDVPFWTVDTLFYSEVHAPNSVKFLFYRFCLINWNQYNEASGVPSLNSKTIESVEVSCPDGNEQDAIAVVLREIDNEIITLETKLQKARHLKQGMMQELLTGRIRLV